jgi:hypothetical protein
MLEKRKEHFDRLAEEIDRHREEAGERIEREEKPRRVDPTTLFLRMREMQQKGGATSVPLC